MLNGKLTVKDIRMKLKLFGCEERPGPGKRYALIITELWRVQQDGSTTPRTSANSRGLFSPGKKKNGVGGWERPEDEEVFGKCLGKS